MYQASMDIKTAFDVTKPKRIARIMEEHNVYGWTIAALLREMAGLEGQALFESAESKFSFGRCIRQGSVQGPRLWQKMAMQLLAEVEKERVRILCASFQIWKGENSPDLQFHVGGQLLGHIPFEGPSGTYVEGCNAGSRKMGFRTEGRKFYGGKALSILRRRWTL